MGERVTKIRSIFDYHLPQLAQALNPPALPPHKAGDKPSHTDTSHTFDRPKIPQPRKIDKHFQQDFVELSPQPIPLKMAARPAARQALRPVAASIRAPGSQFTRSLSHNASFRAPATATGEDFARDPSRKTHFGYETVTEAEKQERVAGVFTSVAESYDRMNDLMSFGWHRVWK